MDAMQVFKAVLVMMAFYSLGITSVSYVMCNGSDAPVDACPYYQSFSEVSSEFSLNESAELVQGSLERQSSIPVIEVGALVFYSGNILLDLLGNFLFALPQMIGMLINGVMMVFNINSQLFAFVQAFASVIMMVMYVVGIMQLVLGIRSGRIV